MLNTQYGRPAARAAGEEVYKNIRSNPGLVPDLILAFPLNRSYESQAHLRQGVQLGLSELSTSHDVLPINTSHDVLPISTSHDVPPILMLNLLRAFC